MNKLFLIIYLCLLFSSFVCSIVRFRYLPGAFKLFSLLLGVTFVVESIAFYGLFYAKPALYLYHFYNPFLYALVAYVYAAALKTPWKKHLIKVSIPIIVALNALLTVFVQPLHTPNTYASMLTSALFTLLSLTYYYELLKYDETANLRQKPLFWISTGNLIFYAGVFFLEGFVSYFINYAPDLGMKLMFLNYFLNYILYTLYTLGFLSTKANHPAAEL